MKHYKLSIVASLESLWGTIRYLNTMLLEMFNFFLAVDHINTRATLRPCLQVWIPVPASEEDNVIDGDVEVGTGTVLIIDRLVLLVRVPLHTENIHLGKILPDEPHNSAMVPILELVILRFELESSDRAWRRLVDRD